MRYQCYWHCPCKWNRTQFRCSIQDKCINYHEQYKYYISAQSSYIYMEYSRYRTWMKIWCHSIRFHCPRCRVYTPISSIYKYRWLQITQLYRLYPSSRLISQRTHPDRCNYEWISLYSLRTSRSSFGEFW